jgi:hypothetical protein
MFGMTITDLERLPFQVSELNHFPHMFNKDMNHWQERLLWVHRMAHYACLTIFQLIRLVSTYSLLLHNSDMVEEPCSYIFFYLLGLCKIVTCGRIQYPRRMLDC